MAKEGTRQMPRVKKKRLTRIIAHTARGNIEHYDEEDVEKMSYRYSFLK